MRKEVIQCIIRNRRFRKALGRCASLWSSLCSCRSGSGLAGQEPIATARSGKGRRETALSFCRNGRARVSLLPQGSHRPDGGSRLHQPQSKSLRPSGEKVPEGRMRGACPSQQPQPPLLHPHPASPPSPVKGEGHGAETPRQSDEHPLGRISAIARPYPAPLEDPSPLAGEATVFLVKLVKLVSMVLRRAGWR